MGGEWEAREIMGDRAAVDDAHREDEQRVDAVPAKSGREGVRRARVVVGSRITDILPTGT